MHSVRVTPAVIDTPPTATRHSVDRTAEPCTLTASAATELAMTLQPFRLTVVAPENCAARDAEGCSARMQAFDAVENTATDRARAITGAWEKKLVKNRSCCWARITSTARGCWLGPLAGGVLTSMVPTAGSKPGRGEVS